ncbi:MAG: hypothetical protein KDD62_05715, partial [Bdellovibrionales bacterium]|nr:hypothetical protein [Bdellovibrionales bacterium]
MKQRNQILQSITKHHDVKWLLEVTSLYDCLFAVMAHSFADVSKCFEEIFEKHGDFIHAKQ